MEGVGFFDAYGDKAGGGSGLIISLYWGCLWRLEMAKTNGQVLEEKLKEALVDGEAPYQANREAVKILDIFGRVDEGVEILKDLVAGIDVLVARLEVFRDAANAVSRRALSTVR